jgi:hypothetical protein
LSDLRQHGAPRDWRSIIATRYRRGPADLSRLVIVDLTVFGSDASPICISGPRSTSRLAPLFIVPARSAVFVREPESAPAFPFRAGAMRLI